MLRKLLDTLPWPILIFIALTLGLAPFAPPHLVAKLSMLKDGTLVKPVDWFDLVMHGSPWALLVIKGLLMKR